MIKLPLDPQTFLARYWQQQPLHIPAAIPGFNPPLSVEELAGLALEEDVESRIVAQAHERSDAGNSAQWSVEHGPFTETDFQRLDRWTLLVQAVDQYVPEVARLRQLIDFIPGWRIDDVMVSYGNDGASVGPHYDNYDVFLLQGEGEKLWRIGQRCDATTALAEHAELRILQDFQVQDEYLLSAGDILYVPPGVAHWGIAQGESTTFSIGFRAPRINDMLSRFADAALERLDPDLFFADAGREAVADGGEIAVADIARARRQMIAAITALDDDGKWLAELVTEPRCEGIHDSEDLALQIAALAQSGSALCMEPAARLAWIRGSQDVTVFANGYSTRVTESELHYLQTLWHEQRLEEGVVDALRAQTQGAMLVNFLLEAGCVYVERHQQPG